MSKADEIFVRNARYILEHGTSTEGQEVRPHWPDGTPAYTVKQFGVAEEYDLQEEFPAMTLRKTGIKSATEEILWIWQKKSNNIHDFSLHIWDSWADETGSIKKAYGYQAGKVSVFRRIDKGRADLNEAELDKYKERISAMNLPSVQYKEYTDGTAAILMDQTDAILYQLKYEPFSRRIQASLWNVDELTEMGLQPCCWSFTLNVTDDRRADGKLTLNMVLNQRSNDMLAANNWNTVQYAVLLMMFAQASGMVAGKLLHVIVDQHIYDRHIPLVKELIERPQYPAPKVWLDPEVTDFYKFTKDSLHVEDYTAGEQMKFEVAI